MARIEFYVRIKWRFCIEVGESLRYIRSPELWLLKSRMRTASPRSRLDLRSISPIKGLKERTRTYRHRIRAKSDKNNVFIRMQVGEGKKKDKTYEFTRLGFARGASCWGIVLVPWQGTTPKYVIKRIVQVPEGWSSPSS